MAANLLADRAHVGGSGAEVGVRKPREARRERVHRALPRLLGGDRLLVDQCVCRPDEVVVLEQEQVCVEDLGLVLARRACNVVAGRAELLTNGVERGTQAVALERRWTRGELGGLRVEVR
jgi:hypothetical protein